MSARLSMRTRKFIGTFFIVILVVLYALIAVAIATTTIPNAAWYVHMLYFMFTGILWILPAMGIISWMSKD